MFFFRKKNYFPKIERFGTPQASSGDSAGIAVPDDPEDLLRRSRSARIGRLSRRTPDMSRRRGLLRGLQSAGPICLGYIPVAITFGAVATSFGYPFYVPLLFSAAIFVGLVLRRNFIRLVMASVMQLDEEGWRKMAIRWGWFFVALAALNEVVWRTFSTDTWVAFKVFGIMPLTVLFSVAQVPLISRHMVEEDPPTASGGRPSNPRGSDTGRKKQRKPSVNCLRPCRQKSIYRSSLPTHPVPSI